MDIRKSSCSISVPQRGVWKAGKKNCGKPLTSETKVSYSEPGDYRIRAIATDGATFSTYDVDVKVNPRASAQNAP